MSFLDELKIVEENGKIEVKCEFCQTIYSYCKKDLEILKKNRAELCEATVKALCESFGVTYKAAAAAKPATQTSTQTSFMVKIIYAGSEGLNIRQDANASSKVVGVVKKDQVFTIVEQKNGFGKLKSGAGWISLNAKYVKKL